MGRRVVSGGLLLILRLLLLLDVARLEAGGKRVLGALQGERLVEFDLRLLERHNAAGAKLAVFRLPAAAGCTVADAKVELQAEHHHDGDDDHDNDHDHDHDKAAGADRDQDEHGGHKEFHVTYALDCAKPASITAIAFDYFKMFAGAHDLTVNVVTAKAQNSYEVSRDAPSLDLAGIM